MTAQIIQFIPRTEHLVRDLSEPVVVILPVIRVERFSDDVQLPSDSEPDHFSTDEYNEPPCA